ncbi:MAG: TVP38/TMEM64 family protein [Oscillospiraceae bacterium]|nr:TVP38/TMEM64 family protein [Oscillospiraceae bacterium]
MDEQNEKQAAMLPVGKKEQIIWGIALVLMWGGIGFLLYRSHGDLTVEQLLQYQPENPLLAALMLWGLFLLKSVDFIMYSSVFYAASGIMFPTPVALLVNLVGIFILCTVPYFIGRRMGAPLLWKLQEKYPRLREMESLSGKQGFVFAFLLRSVNLPVTVVSLYLGARQCSFPLYLAGSFCGLMPVMIPFTIMGDSITNVGSPMFIGAAAADVLLAVASFIWIVILKRRQARKRLEAAAGAERLPDYTRGAAAH